MQTLSPGGGRVVLALCKRLHLSMAHFWKETMMLLLPTLAGGGFELMGWMLGIRDGGLSWNQEPTRCVYVYWDSL